MPTGNADSLLDFYTRELTYLREMGAEFARRYPKVASRLELSGDTSPDPHVERLLEAFAFLTGRIQHQIDSEYPEITSALLGVLYPFFVTPIPSMAIAEFRVDPDQGKLTSGHTIEAGTQVFAQSLDGINCRFRTGYPATLWPLEVVDAGFESTAQFRFLDNVSDVSTVLRIKLEPRGISLPELELDRLRFYLSGPQSLVNDLYQLIFNQTRDVMLWEPDAAPQRLPAGSISPVGFGLHEEVLPFPDHCHPGYRLLQEYFAFPQKFQFFDLANLSLRRDFESLDILILLKEAPRGRLNVDRETFRLGCAPIINLFPKTSEPIRYDHRQTEYRLVPDFRREPTTEIHSIQTVTSSSDPTERAELVEPYYSFNHHMQQSERRAFWHARRLPCTLPDVPGTELRISFLDLNFKPAEPSRRILYAHALCTNRGVAEQLQNGAELQVEEAAPLIGISCLGKPTPQVNPPMGGDTLWRLISQLSLNHLSLSAGPSSLQALREILRLSCFTARASDERQIQGILEMETRKIVRRVGPDAWRGFCRGHEITLFFDEAEYVGGGAYLFGAVLNHYFALYTSINSFTRLRIRSRQREGIWEQWPPMAGEKLIL